MKQVRLGDLPLNTTARCKPTSPLFFIRGGSFNIYVVYCVSDRGAFFDPDRMVYVDEVIAPVNTRSFGGFICKIEGKEPTVLSSSWVYTMPTEMGNTEALLNGLTALFENGYFTEDFDMGFTWDTHPLGDLWSNACYDLSELSESNVEDLVRECVGFAIELNVIQAAGASQVYLDTVNLVLRELDLLTEDF